MNYVDEHYKKKKKKYGIEEITAVRFVNIGINLSH